jgi:molybdopterin/thiamine biosynthesis adenylyltransferase
MGMSIQSSPVAVLFTHELGIINFADAQFGKGCAVLLDHTGEMPDSIHLRLGETSPGGYSSGYFLPLIWKTGNIPNDVLSAFPADTEQDCALLFLDSSQGHYHAACVISHLSRKFLVNVKIVETGAHTFTRNKAILESDILRHKVALCIGLGSGGAPVVNDLVRSGVGKFILWDNDRIEAHNVGRHICGIEDIGRLKTHVLRDRILSINPQAIVNTVEEDVLDQSGIGKLLYEAVATADVVIAATDNNPSRFAINEAAWGLRKPALYGRAFTRACGGDVIQVVPSQQTPCYACHIQERVVDEEISSQRDADAIAYADRPVPIEPGLHVDITPISNMISRLALAHLAIGTGSSLELIADELNAPLYLWGNRREHNFAQWEPMQRTFSKMSILRWYGITIPANKHCCVCGKASID